MTIAKMIETNKELKAQFNRIVALEKMTNSIDYVKNEDATQQEIDDHTTVNGEFAKAIETMGLTSAQYYEAKEILAADDGEIKAGDIIRMKVKWGQ